MNWGWGNGEFQKGFLVSFLKNKILRVSQSAVRSFSQDSIQSKAQIYSLSSKCLNGPFMICQMLQWLAPQGTLKNVPMSGQDFDPAKKEKKIRIGGFTLKSKISHVRDFRNCTSCHGWKFRSWLHCLLTVYPGQVTRPFCVLLCLFVTQG